MLGPILKALGVKISDADIQRLEVLIPQIPGKAAEIVNTISLALKAADARIAALESQQAELLKILEAHFGRTNGSNSDNTAGPRLIGTGRG